ncbi:hypothetical protein [Rhizobium lentis]|uniref:DUF416 family protein n=1 Tax=Rhizobium lentis TaxID=1138194 RepID=A0A7W9CY29_9HYPH|nr:hypothetical protein [Rhizobium lentis]MBB4576906.1 hypothetical protein [Rhizobium lentis]MBB5553467.1 hypothetical protein [Rhizobium lentis]MBB5564103.1 hypothetical protein [Rhizobium lentis]MBB5570515.1 hypothetical protein [Rhizobium lentis]
MVYADGYSEASLDRLSINKCVWVALAAATRQSKNYARLPIGEQAGIEILGLLADVWDAAARQDIAFCEMTLQRVMDSLPPEDTDNSIDVIIAENCLLSLAYALRCQINGEKKEAHWALMKAYDAADQIALILWRAQNGESFAEAEIRAMPVVQRELANQAAAFDTAFSSSESEALALLEGAAFAVEFATPNEWLALAS